ncbi:hypothetical protein PT2222_90240 [Paraburkholderia tropica]
MRNCLRQGTLRGNGYPEPRAPVSSGRRAAGVPDASDATTAQASPQAVIVVAAAARRLKTLTAIGAHRKRTQPSRSTPERKD